jgi:hypothetical protein
LFINNFQLSQAWRTEYGGRYTVTLLHGDGVGPELMEHVKAAIRLENSFLTILSLLNKMN